MSSSNGLPFCHGCGLAFDTDIRLRWHESQPRSACHRFYSGLDDEIDRLIQAGETLAQQTRNERLFRRTDLPSLSNGSMNNEQIGSHSGFADDLMPDDDIHYPFSMDYDNPNAHDDEDGLDDVEQNNFGELCNFETEKLDSQFLECRRR
jgi:hypothetical protein